MNDDDPLGAAVGITVALILAVPVWALLYVVVFR